jgi:glycine cleavage system H lipoate-binding protein
VSDLPQYCEPVVGFRAWRAGADGVLTPWTMAQAPWEPGVNEGRCLRAGAGAHAVPGHECSCGLYALARLDDPRLDPAFAAVGSIAAWGEIEVHATGFRARYATITGLALPARCTEAHRACLDAAAERYGVALVAHHELAEHALAFGAPVAFERIPDRPHAPPPPPGPRLDDRGLRGIAVDDHVWVEIAGAGAVTLGITAAFAGEISICSPVRSAGLGETRRAGATLATIGDGDGRLVVRAPFDLVGFELNPVLAGDPDLVRTHPESAGWLVRAAPLAWERQARDLLWGARAVTLYRASVAHAARVEDPFGWQKPAWVALQPRARSAADALAILDAQRRAPRFADADAVREQIGGRLDRALAEPGVRASACRARVRLALRLREPDAELALDLDGDSDRQITFEGEAQDADLFLAGRLDIAAALRSRRIRTDASHTRMLVVASLIKELQRAYRAQG